MKQSFFLFFSTWKTFSSDTWCPLMSEAMAVNETIRKERISCDVTKSVFYDRLMKIKQTSRVTKHAMNEYKLATTRKNWRIVGTCQCHIYVCIAFAVKFHFNSGVNVKWKQKRKIKNFWRLIFELRFLNFKQNGSNLGHNEHKIKTNF